MAQPAKEKRRPLKPSICSAKFAAMVEGPARDENSLGR